MRAAWREKIEFDSEGGMICTETGQARTVGGRAALKHRTERKAV